MREIICRHQCSFFNPEKDEAETCLGYAWLTAWSKIRPGLKEILTGLPAGVTPRVGSLASLEEAVCQRCVFRAHGCDFAAAAEPETVQPCGGLKVLAWLQERGYISAAEVQAAWEKITPRLYVRLGEHVALRRLEAPHLYDRLADELYEVNEEAFDWLAQADGTRQGWGAQADAEFFAFLLEESLLACSPTPAPRKLSWRPSPLPSLRYLELMLTERCNLRCAHCYLGDAGTTDLPLASALAALRELEEMQGLRALLSGGEALLWPHWWDLNDRLGDFELRMILLSNGVLLTPEVVSRLRVQEIQVSLDGLEQGHEMLRGRGTWDRTVRNLKAVQDAGLALSVATMIHAGNLEELEDLGELLQQWGVREWNLDVPCYSGRLLLHPELYADPAAAVSFLGLGYGGSDHGAEGGYACGVHHAAVLPTGQVAKCGLYAHRPLGRLAEGLETCWRRLKHLRLEELECNGCDYLTECRGGCRFRAGEGLAPDPVMCLRYGGLPGGGPGT